MTKIKTNEIELCLNENNLCFSFQNGKEKWNWNEGYRPRLECEEGTVYFENACVCEHTIIRSGIGQGIQSHFENFEINGKKISYSFDTRVWIEETTGNVFCEWIPICEEGLRVKAVYWPGEMAFDERKENWYTLLNEQQGLLIPNTWKNGLEPIAFDGFFGTAGGYMPWYAQVRDRAGYLAICITPWNAGYQAEHPENGPYTHVSMRFEPSFGRMEYRRIVRYTFLNDCDYNDICKTYRTYVKEQGRLKTLAEKAAKNPSVEDLIGCAFVHKGIKTSVERNSDFYDAEAPEKNNHLTTFAQREAEMRKLHDMGVEKLYLHLDGWAQPGYDNLHPDYLPACSEAGGWEGMKSLADAMQDMGYLFGIHDQYRDFYKSAPSFDPQYACQLTDGSIPEHQRWAGGPQSYLCTTQAPFYVKRNFTEIEKHDIHLDCAYLDVFTCNEGDECNNPHHKMSRRDCYDYRNQCFEYLLSKGILPSSEEVSDWCVPSLVFCHYAPYDFMLREPGKPKQGVPVPLYNLVYHDCMIEPWMMDKVSETEDYMLYALLNGGAPYLIRDGAYPNFDGSFESLDTKIEEEIGRSKVVSDLHKKVAKCEMVRHEMVNGNYEIQRTTFADGTMVTVDFKKQTYIINGSTFES
ncbi:MAG: DUF5696 domain-containing protein [Hespellia sp.]|nr:DUF5696 domain-containing protein [Hespellia sp.]